MTWLSYPKSIVPKQDYKSVSGYFSAKLFFSSELISMLFTSTKRNRLMFIISDYHGILFRAKGGVPAAITKMYLV